MAAEAQLDVGGRTLAIRHLDRVVFPRTGTTKAQLLDYYVRISGVMLPHLRQRLLHMHRYPEGVEGPRFWQKGCPDFRPAWMPTARVWSRAKRDTIDYCVVNELAAFLWAVNLGSIETPARVVSRMQKALRTGKVLIDWSQNTTHKSMVCAYSVREGSPDRLDAGHVGRGRGGRRRRRRRHARVRDGRCARARRRARGRVRAGADAEAGADARERGDLFEPVLTLRRELTRAAQAHGSSGS